jgi:hypothetical protein
MKRVLTPLSDCTQTAREIKRIVNTYYADLNLCLYRRGANGKSQPIGKMNLQDFFNFVKNIPFKIDKRPVEYVARPYLLMQKNIDGLDCKKKTIMIASWLKSHKTPFQLVGSSIRHDGKIHHIFPRGFIGGRWRPIDATYPNNRLFQKKNNTAEVIFYDSSK